MTDKSEFGELKIEPAIIVPERSSQERMAMLAALEVNAATGAKGSEPSEFGRRQSEMPDGLTLANLESLREIDGLKPEVWKTMEISERQTAIVELERRLAIMQGREEANVEFRDDLRPGIGGRYSPSLNTIQINSNRLEGSDPWPAVNTIAHEGRHAYQMHAIRHPEVHHDSDEVASWRQNSTDRKSIEKHGYDAYRNQPLEKDAFAYGDSLAKVMAGEHADKESG